MNQSLVRILFHQAKSFPLVINKKIKLGICSIKMKTAKEATVQFHGSSAYSTTISISSVALRNQIKENEQAQLWRVSRPMFERDMPQMQTEFSYILEVCSFPRTQSWIHPLPMYIPPSIESEWNRFLDGKTWEYKLFCIPKNIIMGIPLIAVLDEKDENQLCVWTRSGTVLVFLVRDVHLELIEILSETELDRALSYPNTLFEIQDAKQLQIVVEGENIVPEGLLSKIIPQRSFVMKLWSQYLQIKNSLDTALFESRTKYPLSFYEGTSSKGIWKAKVNGAEEAMLAWMTDSSAKNKKQKIEQSISIHCEKDSQEPIQGVLTSISRSTETLLKIECTISKGRFPKSGSIHVRKNSGTQVMYDRQRTALSLLSQGKSINVHLLSLLAEPKKSRAPKDGALSLLPEEVLSRQRFPPDKSQGQAIKGMYNCRDIVAVQGPPGTGKTRIIVQTLLHIAQKSRSENKKIRVLVSSVQNEAVFGVVERLIQEPFLSVHYIGATASNERMDRDYQKKIDRLYQTCISHFTDRYTENPFMKKEEELRALQREGQALISRAFSFDEWSEGNKDKFVEELRSYIHSRYFFSKHQARMEEVIQQMSSTSVADDKNDLSPLPEDCSAISGWLEKSKEQIPLDVRSPIQSKVNKIGFFLKRNKADKAQALRVEIVNLLPKPVSSQAESGSVKRKLFSLFKIVLYPHIRTCLQELYNTKEGAALAFYRQIQDPDLFRYMYSRHSTTTATTTSRAGKEFETYDWVIIDEAGRASPLELFIPMVQGKRIVLIGDHRQLPPMIEDAIWKKSEYKNLDIRKVNIFSEFFGYLPVHCRFQLQTQYRSHRDIVQLINDNYYKPHNESIEAFFSVDDAFGARFPFDCSFASFSSKSVLHKTTPINMFHRQAVVWRNVVSQNKKTINRLEVEEVRTILHAFYDKISEFRKDIQGHQQEDKYRSFGYGKQPIAVIVPYSEQRAEMENLFKKEPRYKEIAQIKTIDSVQGREYPIVIMSLVRSDNSAGFMSSPNRMNVAISRAQYQLILVGHKKGFLSNRVKKTAKELYNLVKRVTQENP